MIDVVGLVNNKILIIVNHIFFYSVVNLSVNITLIIVKFAYSMQGTRCEWLRSEK